MLINQKRIYSYIRVGNWYLKIFPHERRVRYNNGRVTRTSRKLPASSRSLGLMLSFPSYFVQMEIARWGSNVGGFAKSNRHKFYRFRNSVSIIQAR